MITIWNSNPTYRSKIDLRA